jgi:hypothetical protein
MDGNSPYPLGYGASPPGHGSPQPPGGPRYIPQPPADFRPSAPSARSRTGLLASGVALAVLLGIAALVLSIIGISRSPQPSPPPAAPQAEPARVFVDDADTALCRAIGPLMKESDQTKRAFTDSGPAGSPERAAAIPKFKADTLDWANRIQDVLNDHSDPPRYLTRTVQKYIDGMLLYTENIYEDRQPDAFDKATWDSAIVAYGGPLGTCQKLGAMW